MTPAVDFDHVSFAVRDALAWASRLRATLGATPVAGETLAEFRYLLLHLGTGKAGGRLELIEPVRDGFLARFLAARGEGAHHLTFLVPDLRAMVGAFRGLGAAVVGEDYAHAPWQEAFVKPDARLGTVIQLAQSDRRYPSPAELLATRARDRGRMPGAAGATDGDWWSALWATGAGSAVPMGAVHLAATDMAFARRVFGDLLDGHVTERGEGASFAWGSGAIEVYPAGAAGIRGVSLGSDAPSLRIGAVTLGIAVVPENRPLAASTGLDQLMETHDVVVRATRRR